MRNHKHVIALVGAPCLGGHTHAKSIPITATPSVIVSTTTEPVAQGKFQRTWESLSQYQ